MRTSQRSWRTAVFAAFVSGAVASVASSVALMLAGKRELGDAAAPLNGPSQWVWGKHAPYRSGCSLRHTALGYAIHHLASIFWATFYERARPEKRPVAAAVLTSAVACFVDYKLTPERFTPGFEKRLSKRALFSAYAAFALGLAAAHVLRGKEVRWE
jgi:hypothetical protein